MGTNFYLRDEAEEYERGQHLGKRSAAGMYCYACNISLVTGMPGGFDVESPHISKKPYGVNRGYEQCPKCGAKPSGNFYLPELFMPTQEQTEREEMYPVRYSFSFGFALAPEEISLYAPDTEVVDEYGRVFLMHEFWSDVLAKAVFLFTEHIGQEFS